jgi:hypothetical protein
MTKPVCPKCKKVDHGAILPSDHGGRFYSTRCGNCGHRYMYDAHGVSYSGDRAAHEPKPEASKELSRQEMYEEAFVLLQRGQDLLEQARCAHEKAMMAGRLSDEPLQGRPFNAEEATAYGEFIEAHFEPPPSLPATITSEPACGGAAVNIVRAVLGDAP